jgi:hypothetical protein
VSLYLLLAHGRLQGFEFANSLSIRAFEEISRGARRWNDGQPPEQMTLHTELPDERVAGFLHLRLQESSTDSSIDFLLPDLPGEWSTSLIDSNRIDRLGFLKSVDAIWLMLDGQQLANMETRQLSLHRTKVLMQRIATFLTPEAPPVILVLSRRDLGVPERSILETLEKEAVRLGITMATMPIASFSDQKPVPPGTGIAELISQSIRHPLAERSELWPDQASATEKRCALNFRTRRLRP